MMDKPNDGLTAWQQQSNHNRMIALQQRHDLDPMAEGPVELAFFGSSAFRVTSPAGLTVMLDPWRNLPTRTWDWYFHDFPQSVCDIGVATHAHFDHDALHRLDAHTLLDRPIGTFQFGDVRITGIADKHAIDFSHTAYDGRLINETFNGQRMAPPDNARSWDNCLVIVETGGLRILHWGDNRHDPPDATWELLGAIDIALLPIDGSFHVLSEAMVADIISRLQPRVVVPSHYYSWTIVQRQSTLLPVAPWLTRQPSVRHVGSAVATYERATMPDALRVDSFDDHVAFDVQAWHAAHGLDIDLKS